jgi:hypothetical protein
MGRMKEIAMEIRERQLNDPNDDYFELITEEEFENYIRSKYGYGIAGTMKLAQGETADDNVNTDVLWL